MNIPDNCQNISLDYQLVDSGNLKKLERFGGHLLVRPCSHAIWNPSKAKNIWAEASAEFHHDNGWRNPKKLETWSIQISKEKKLNLRLQDNGQIGIFPEHYEYLENINQQIAGKEKIKILNLFAYTGMASIYLSTPTVEITHIDINKKCLDWTKENINSNSGLGTIRLINEDAEDFINKEIRREKKYQVVIIDPPSFSRVTRSKSWDLEDILPDLVSLLVKVIDPKNFAIYFTSHLQQGFANSISNIFWDHFKETASYEQILLNLKETDSGRELPCSNLSIIKSK